MLATSLSRNWSCVTNSVESLSMPETARSARLCRLSILLPSLFGSQPHTWPPAIGELDTSGFQYSAYGCHCLGIARIPTGLDLGDSVAVEASFFRQLLNGPIKQATRGPNLRRCHNCWKRLYILCAELYDGSMSAAPPSREFEWLISRQELSASLRS
jgi:hypothetical protein